MGVGLIRNVQKTNNPADVAPAPQPGQGGLYDERAAAFNTPGPYIPSEGIKNNLGEPKVRLIEHTKIFAHLMAIVF